MAASAERFSRVLLELSIPLTISLTAYWAVVPMTAVEWTVTAVIVLASVLVLWERAMAVSLIRAPVWAFLGLWLYLLLRPVTPLDVIQIALFATWVYVLIVVGIADTTPRPLPRWLTPRFAVPLSKLIFEQCAMQVGRFRLLPLLYLLLVIPFCLFFGSALFQNLPR